MDCLCVRENKHCEIALGFLNLMELRKPAHSEEAQGTVTAWVLAGRIQVGGRKGACSVSASV